MNSYCDLSQKKCIPCQGGISPLKSSSLLELLQQLEKGWKVIDEHHLVKEYFFKDFNEALVFTNRVSALAEEEGHHPDILLSYGKVKIELWTHKINGLAESDFILAAKIEKQALLQSKQAIVTAYFDGLEKGSYSDVIELFSPNAIVHSPLYGQIEATRFYQELFADTKSSQITLKNVFVSLENPHTAAAQFVYSWTLKDGTPVCFECVDVFDFVPESAQIKKLTIIYDTHHTREEFSKVHDS